MNVGFRLCPGGTFSHAEVVGGNERDLPPGIGDNSAPVITWCDSSSTNSAVSNGFRAKTSNPLSDALSGASGYMSNLVVPPHGAVLFIDDTGDDALRDPLNPVFGLGGCAVMGDQLDSLIRQPWKIVRQTLRGGYNLPVHASDIERRLSPAKERAVNNYFAQYLICRLAVLVSSETSFDVGDMQDKVVFAAAGSIGHRIVEISRFLPFDSLDIVVEQSQRLVPKLERATAGFKINSDGSDIPMRWHVMPKNSNEPGLEVADFLMHTIAGFCRSKRDPKSKFAQRFHHMMSGADPSLTSFMEISTVTKNAV